MTLPSKKLLLKELDKTVLDIIEMYQAFPKYNFPIDDKRTAKDVLKHIVFWHESFSRNIFAVSHGKTPKPLKGTYAKLSAQCKQEMTHESIKSLITRFVNAHAIIQENILHPEVKTIPYRIGSRDYTPQEHLDVVNHHLQGHLAEVKAAYERTTH